jgi:uncharacterized membrane protein YkoI
MVGLVVLATGLRADDKPEKIPLDKIPKIIKAAIDGRFPGAELTSVEKESENGQIVFDVELKHEGRKYEMDIKEDGTIMEIEKEIALKDVPKTITQAVQTKYADAVIKEVMEVNKVKDKKETPIHYEVTIQTADKKTKEVIVSLDGKTVKAEGEDKK